ncbi:hypothetical protein CLF_102121 [Clonorchis sinensis]|uniref:Uncharacterized protein n=1 Tax=Clonorchis sinensis TaxID=79923 RepID=G7Y7C2_CLOSI|nr:hypothetical protein CLF_102121 [Clonorchis sinensis]
MAPGLLLIYLLIGTVSLQVHTFTPPKRASLSYFKRAEQPSPQPFLDSPLRDDLEKRASLSYFKRAIPPLKRASLSYFKRGHSAFDREEDFEEPYYVYNMGDFAILAKTVLALATSEAKAICEHAAETDRSADQNRSIPASESQPSISSVDSLFLPLNSLLPRMQTAFSTPDSKVSPLIKQTFGQDYCTNLEKIALEELSAECYRLIQLNQDKTQWSAKHQLAHATECTMLPVIRKKHFTRIPISNTHYRNGREKRTHVYIKRRTVKVIYEAHVRSVTWVRHANQLRLGHAAPATSVNSIPLDMSFDRFVLPSTNVLPIQTDKAPVECTCTPRRWSSHNPKPFAAMQFLFWKTSRFMSSSCSFPSEAVSNQPDQMILVILASNGA